MMVWVVLLSLALSLLLLFKKVAWLAQGGGRRLQDERAEVEWLQRTLLRLRAMLSDAGQKQIIKDESLVLWLQEIKDVACDAEDVIDEFEYQQLRSKVEEGSSLPSFQPSTKAMVHKIKEIRRRLEAIAKERNDLRIGDLGGWTDQEDTQKRMIQTSSLLKEQEVLGREKEMDETVDFLLATDDDDTAPSTIAITGMGGVGKTTLAQLVYNDERVKEHFDLRMWVHMAADYDVLRLTRELLSSTNGCREIFCGLENLDVYQRKLVKKLKGKRFLLVVDDLWDRDRRKWQSLHAPLIKGAKGSKILVTTRDTKVANIFQTRNTVELQGLPFHDCWVLFRKHAFLNGNSAEYPRLEAIGKRIVRKFRGVPLSAITIGGLLHSNLDENQWIRILESEIWELEQGEDGILSALKLSYQHLPPEMKQCFAYCSLFPKNHKFSKPELVQQWMAHGFLQTRGSGRVEDVGTEYFDDLVSRSFLQNIAHDKLVMHDLVRDLALLISQHGDHLITDKDRSHKILKDSHKLRHISLVMTRGQPDQRDLERLRRHRYLRTLAFFFPYWNKFQIPHILFLIPSLKTLRVLDLSSGNIEELPDSIGNLKLLRYLDLRRNAFRRLPESLCCLYKLQTLKLEFCDELEKLPQGISKLINLRHLEVEPEFLSGVAGIGKLTCLQELESFPISRGNGLMIDDLKDMNELRGTLSIWNLQRVRSKEEAMRAMLINKRHLRNLEMKWNESAGRGNKKLEEEVLEALVPPPGLQEFTIEGYGGDNFPSWLDQQCLSKLEWISLRACRNWNSLPSFWCLPFLKSIHIHGCPQLRSLPSLPTTVRELEISDVGLEELPEFYQPSLPVSGSCSNLSPSLSSLSIYRCPALKSLQRGLLRHHLRNLTRLSIENCAQLVDWPEGAGFQGTLLSLQEWLHIVDCPKLVAFPDGSTLSTSLKRFDVRGCPSILNGPLFAQLQNLSSESFVDVRKKYTSLTCCCEEALQHMKTVDWLVIDELGEDELAVSDGHPDCQPVSLVYDKRQVWSWRCDDWVFARRVEIYRKRNSRSYLQLHGGLPFNFVPTEEWWQRRSPSVVERRAVLHNDDDYHQPNSMVSPCLGQQHLPWASSLRWLVANGSLETAFPSSNLSSLEGLWISSCRGTRPLLTEAQLSHLTGLRELQIYDCLELTLSSLQEVIWSLPSFQHLTIQVCPKLSSSFVSCSHSAAIPSPYAATLQTLFLDDAKLLGDAQFVRACLSSLRGLHIWYSDLTCFTSAMEEGLQSLGHSLQHLSFNSCPNLEHLPSDLRKLLPSLKALSMGNCPKFQHLPTGGLPAGLEILVNHGCPVLSERCKPSPPPGQGSEPQQQQTDWPKISHIPVIVNNGYIVQGSYEEFLELRAKWRDF